MRIGGDEVMVMAGPCSAETEPQVRTTAAAVRRAGAKIFRGGAFKPRSSPYSFQGLGEAGLQLLQDAARAENMALVSEVMDVSQIPLIDKYCDMFQVGARNMQNFTLLRELGHMRKPVLLKRGISATIEEWLLSAEYVLSGGNTDVVLCERGIRTFETATRNTFDVSAIPVVKKLSHLPVIGDPSHGAGRRDMVSPMARAAVAAGADGLIIEVHCDPDHALSDGAQSMFPAQFDRLMAELRIIAPAIGRSICLEPAVAHRVGTLTRRRVTATSVVVLRSRSCVRRFDVLRSRLSTGRARRTIVDERRTTNVEPRTTTSSASATAALSTKGSMQLPVIQPGRPIAAQTPVFDKIGIVGLGLIGGSIALAARQHLADLAGHRCRQQGCARDGDAAARHRRGRRRSRRAGRSRPGHSRGAGASEHRAARRAR